MTLKAQQNHFATVATQYASYRPTYPSALIHDVVTLAGGPEITALDLAAGNGQATTALASACATVYASDLAYSQIAAMPHVPNVHTYVSRAEQTGLPDASIDLICVAQAITGSTSMRSIARSAASASPAELSRCGPMHSCVQHRH